MVQQCRKQNGRGGSAVQCKMAELSRIAAVNTGEQQACVGLGCGAVGGEGFGLGGGKGGQRQLGKGSPGHGSVVGWT